MEKKYDFSREVKTPIVNSEQVLPHKYREMLKPTFSDEIVSEESEHSHEDDDKSSDEEGSFRGVYEEVIAQHAGALKLTF